jgi:hypothetical protein
MRLRHVLDRFEHHRAAFMLHQLRARRACLITRAARREIAAQDRHAAFLLERCVCAADHVWPGTSSKSLIASPSVPPMTCFASSVEQVLQFLHQPRHAAGLMEMLHVMVAGRFQVDQHRRLAADLVEVLERERRFGAAGDGGEMHHAVGRAADRLQHRRSHCAARPAS